MEEKTVAMQSAAGGAPAPYPYPVPLWPVMGGGARLYPAYPLESPPLAVFGQPGVSAPLPAGYQVVVVLPQAPVSRLPWPVTMPPPAAAYQAPPVPPAWMLCPDLPRSVVKAFKEPTLQGEICGYCAALANLERDGNGRIVAVFCTQCCIKIALSPAYRCGGGAPDCLGRRIVSALGVPSRLCKNCHAAEVPRS